MINDRDETIKMLKKLVGVMDSLGYYSLAFEAVFTSLALTDKDLLSFIITIILATDATVCFGFSNKFINKIEKISDYEEKNENDDNHSLKLK